MALSHQVWGNLLQQPREANTLAQNKYLVGASFHLSFQNDLPGSVSAHCPHLPPLHWLQNKKKIPQAEALTQLFHGTRLYQAHDPAVPSTAPISPPLRALILPRVKAMS